MLKTYHSRSLGYSLGLHLLVIIMVGLWLRDESTPPPIQEKLAIALSCVEINAPEKPAPLPAREVITTPVVQPVVRSSAAIAPSRTSVTAPVQVPVPAIVESPILVQPTSPSVITAPIPSKKVPPPPPPINVQKEYINAHLGEIREILIQNFKYPKMAQKLKMQGEVRLAFSLASDGTVSNVDIVESSSFEILDQDAVELVKKSSHRFPKPSEPVRINVPLSYVLR